MLETSSTSIPALTSILTPKNANIFRIVHIDNISKILDLGMQCRQLLDNYVEIGDVKLIKDRNSKKVPCYPHGTLSDYVPFYFTPLTPMLYNIKKGKRGVKQRKNEEIVILFSSLLKMTENNLSWVFTDRQAFRDSARFSSNINDLKDYVPWGALQSRNFHRLGNEDGFQRYQAEALVHGTIPLKAFTAFITFNASARNEVMSLVQKTSKKIDVKERPKWYPNE